jgi:hypothetical protein
MNLQELYNQKESRDDLFWSIRYPNGLVAIGLVEDHKLWDREKSKLCSLSFQIDERVDRIAQCHAIGKHMKRAPKLSINDTLCILQIEDNSSSSSISSSRREIRILSRIGGQLIEVNESLVDSPLSIENSYLAIVNEDKKTRSRTH